MNLHSHQTTEAKSTGLTACSVLFALCLLSCAGPHPGPPDLPSRTSITPGETITVQGNENVYAVAREHNVSMRELIVLNNLQPPFALKNGQTLTLPAVPGAIPKGMTSGVPSATAGAVEQVQLAPIATAPTSTLPPAPPADAPVEALNKPTPPPKPVPTTAAPSKTDSVASPTSPPTSETRPTPPAPPPMSMVWPVQGPILSSFGPKGQGLNNDGVNIGAPKGTPVVAAASGIVVYAGNEMKGFGNLILIRHESSWVTAYAHLDRTLVSKDAVVAQGDMIGTVGKTGNAPSPQLHFEVRHESKPVDPAQIIKR